MTAIIAMIIFCLAVIYGFIDNPNVFISTTATAVIALLTGLYVRYAKRQWQVMDITAQATNKASDAAKASSDALMRIEQAWLYLWYDKFAHVDYQDNTIGAHDLAHNFNWHCENAGKTPAFVVATWSRLIEISSMNDLPHQPDYSRGREVVYQGDPLRPGDKTRWFTAPLESTEPIRTYEAVEARHRSRQSFLYAYGFIRYRDVFTRGHIVRFGVVYDSEPELDFERDHWRVAGPDAYNKYEEDKN